MKLITFSASDEKFVENVENITKKYIKDMVFLYAGVHNNDENEPELKFVYCVHTDNNVEPEILIQFARLSKDNHADIIGYNRMAQSQYFDGEAANGPMMRLADFFLDDAMEAKVTDLIYQKDENNDMFFYAFSNGVPIKYYINKTIAIGIDIMNRSIITYNIEREVIREANAWLSMKSEQRNNVEIKEVTAYSINDISKSIKDGGFHKGVVAIEFECIDNFKNTVHCQAVMTYIRDKKLRNRNLTMKLEVMELVYKDAFSIIPYCGQKYINDESYMELISYNNSRDRFEVFLLEQRCFDAIIKEIKDI